MKLLFLSMFLYMKLLMIPFDNIYLNEYLAVFLDFSDIKNLMYVSRYFHKLTMEDHRYRLLLKISLIDLKKIKHDDKNHGCFFDSLYPIDNVLFIPIPTPVTHIGKYRAVTALFPDDAYDIFNRICRYGNLELLKWVGSLYTYTYFGRGSSIGLAAIYNQHDISKYIKSYILS
jgi:hypothetical protein